MCQQYTIVPQLVKVFHFYRTAKIIRTYKILYPSSFKNNKHASGTYFYIRVH